MPFVIEKGLPAEYALTILDMIHVKREAQSFGVCGTRVGQKLLGQDAGLLGIAIIAKGHPHQGTDLGFNKGQHPDDVRLGNLEIAVGGLNTGAIQRLSQ